MSSALEGRLAGHTAIVTGAGGAGCGGVIARLLASEGAFVIATDINVEGLSALAASPETTGQIQIERCDVTQPADFARVVEVARASTGRVDILVNNAALIDPSSFGAVVDISDQSWSRSLDVTLSSVYHGSRAVLPMLAATSGNIVNVASISGVRANINNVGYGVAKAGVIQLTRILAAECGGSGVRANSVSPGMIYYPRPGGYTYLDEPRVQETVWANSALKKYVLPADVANAVLFLASPAAASITGHNLVVDNGMTAYNGLPGNIGDVLTDIQRNQDSTHEPA